MSIPELTPHEAFERLDDYQLIDVREEHEFHGPLGFVEGARLVPLSMLPENAASLERTRPFLLVCRSGMRSGKGCEELDKQEGAEVVNLAGGMIGWNRAGLPVRHSTPTSLADLTEQIIRWVAQVGRLQPDAGREVARQHFEEAGVSLDAPSRAAVEDFIRIVGESLLRIDPPDLDLCMASFRRSLEAFEE